MLCSPPHFRQGNVHLFRGCSGTWCSDGINPRLGRGSRDTGNSVSMLTAPRQKTTLIRTASLGGCLSLGTRTQAPPLTAALPDPGAQAAAGHRLVVLLQKKAVLLLGKPRGIQEERLRPLTGAYVEESDGVQPRWQTGKVSSPQKGASGLQNHTQKLLQRIHEPSVKTLTTWELQCQPNHPWKCPVGCDLRLQ